MNVIRIVNSSGAVSPAARATARSDPLTIPPSAAGYGRIVRDMRARVIAIVEDKDCAVDQMRIIEANAGVYLVDSDFLWSSLTRVDKKNAQRELYLTDLVKLAFRSGAPAAAIRFSGTRDWGK